MRADRLLSLLLLLETRGRMTARDLARRLEVSERTIYRDITALGMAGIPVYAERGPGGGCALLEGYHSDLTGFTEEELRTVFLFGAPGLLNDLGMGKALEAAALKLMAALPAEPSPAGRAGSSANPCRSGQLVAVRRSRAAPGHAATGGSERAKIAAPLPQR